MTESIVLGGGCFWCLEAAYRRVRGISDVTSGYAGGESPNPSYERHGNHAEVVQITYDPTTIPLDTILDIFWTIHDPTSLNRQGADVGPTYRSIILYGSDQQKHVIERSVTTAQNLFDLPIVTEIKPLDTFYPAEDYHQDYYAKNPDVGYCQIVINPKLSKLRQKFASLLVD